MNATETDVIEEEWRPVVGYEGLYEVSNRGRVKRVGAGPGATAGLVRKLSTHPSGRLQVALCNQGVQRTEKVHRLVAMAFIGAPESSDLEVCHNDGNYANNTPSNLRWDTHASNMRDKVTHRTHPAHRQTHCKSGHPLAGDNIRVTAAGERVCLTCQRARMDRFLKKRREQRGHRIH